MTTRRLPTIGNCGCINADLEPGTASSPERPTKQQRLEGVRRAIRDYHERQRKAGR